jgi:hypothetical protein
MKKVKLIIAAIGITIAFGVGQLTAQPAAQPPAAGPAAPKMAPTARQQQFLGDLNAAIRQNHDIKVTRLLADAAGDAELTDVVVEKLWNYQDKPDEQDSRIANTLDKTFAIQQRQRQIELQEQLLEQLKKNQG